MQVEMAMGHVGGATEHVGGAMGQVGGVYVAVC